MSAPKTPSPLLAATAIYLSVAFMIMGNSLQLILLPIRGGIEGFSALQLGMLGSAYFLGFVAACAFAPFLIMRVGHIRTFAALVSIASTTALIYPMAPEIWLWVAMRALMGFCLSGLYLVVESWLNDQATNETRGMLISTYVTIIFAVTTVGQLLVTLFTPDSFVLFSVASVLVSLAAVPIVLTRSSQPPPITLVRFRPVRMFRLSPTGTVSIFLIGVATGSFWAMGAIYADAASGNLTDAAFFMSAVVLGGALIQWPAGRMSDHMDRRQVLIALSALCGLVGIGIILLPVTKPLWLIMGVAFGAGLLPCYAIAAAHVFDFADRADYVEISAGLLLLNGLGSSIGPLLSSAAIELFGTPGMFVTNALVQVALIVFVTIRLARREGLPESEKQDFDLGTSAAVSVVGDEDAVQLSDLVVQDPFNEPQPDSTP